MTSSGLDAYVVVVARPPDPPEQEPDPAEVARAAQQALFTAEREAGLWTAPLNPVRDGRQRSPAPPEAAGDLDGAAGTERGAMCILGPDGGHVSRGLHCPHNLLADGDADEIVARIEF